jgi:hypothetical protein
VVESRRTNRLAVQLWLVLLLQLSTLLLVISAWPVPPRLQPDHSGAATGTDRSEADG